MRVLVIGAGGFLGGPIAARLAAAPGLTVTSAGRPHLDLSTGPAEVAAVLREIAPDAVVNATGRTSGTDTQLVAGNVITTGNLVAAVRLAAPHARLVHLGSAAEYGMGEPGRAARESDQARPVSVYGMAKLTATQLVCAAGLDSVVLRIFNPVGPGAPASTLPGRLLAELRRAESPIYTGPIESWPLDGGSIHNEPIRTGPLNAVRDFVDVADVAEAVLAAVLAQGRLPVVNIGSGRPSALRELATGLMAAAGSTAPLAEDAPGSARSAGVPWQCADIRLARTFLGWSPRIPLQDSLRRMWTENASVLA